MSFADRTAAGEQLGRALARFRAEQPLVLGLPRGGVIVGACVAAHLAGDLDVLLVKKLRAPGNPELAVGAVCEEGRAYRNDELIALTGADEAYVTGETAARLAEMADQQRRYRAVRPRVPMAGRTVIVVDDGLATGATMVAAVQVIRLAAPRALIVAVPVAPPDTLALIRHLPQVDAVECLLVPTWFGGVGQFYGDFAQVEDDEVVEVLRQWKR